MKFNVPDTGEGLLPIIEVNDVFASLPDKNFYQVQSVTKDQRCKCMNILTKEIVELANMILLNEYAFVRKGKMKV